MDTVCFREWGRIMDQKPDQLVEDAMIAATARVHDLIVATRNERDFKRLDVRILNPFKTRCRADALASGAEAPDFCWTWRHG